MADNDKPEITIAPHEADKAFLAVLSSLIDELRTSQQIEGERLARRIQLYSDASSERTAGTKLMIDYFINHAKRNLGGGDE